MSWYKGRDICATINEMERLLEKYRPRRPEKRCNHCQGTGWESGDKHICFYCSGRGYVNSDDQITAEDICSSYRDKHAT